MTLALQSKQVEEIEKIIQQYKNIFGGKSMQTNNYLPTGNKALDEMLKGGYLKGTLTEISGVTDSGKTLLALKAIKQVQQENILHQH